METVIQGAQTPIGIVALTLTFLAMVYAGHKLLMWVWEWKHDVDADRETFKEFMASTVHKLDSIQEDIEKIKRILDQQPPASGTGSPALRAVEPGNKKGTVGKRAK